jgi:uncharacterized protein
MPVVDNFEFTFLVFVLAAAILHGGVRQWMQTRIENNLRDFRHAAEAAEMTAAACRVEEKFMAKIVLAAEHVSELDMPTSHGIEHARVVFFHAVCAVQSWTGKPFDMLTKYSILLAALLHDVDDRKYFPENKNYENARRIMDAILITLDVQDEVIEMIELVSSSQNGDSVPWNAEVHPWMLIPRHCDRLEAIGNAGIYRAWDYTIETKRPLITGDTEIAHSVDELWKIASLERYAAYNGKSKSMVDHFYDKLLRLGGAIKKSDNEYLAEAAASRETVMIDFCLAASDITDEIPEEFIERLIFAMDRQESVVMARAKEIYSTWTGRRVLQNSVGI